MDKESDLNAAVDNLELKGSGWVYDQNASNTIDFHKSWQKKRSSYVELPMKCFLILHV